MAEKIDLNEDRCILLFQDARFDGIVECGREALFEIVFEILIKPGRQYFGHARVCFD